VSSPRRGPAQAAGAVLLGPPAGTGAPRPAFRGVVLRLSRPPVSFRLDPRVTAVCGVLAAAGLAGFVLSVSIGEFPIPLGDVLPAVLGAGDADSDFIVRTLRLPRALTAVLVGAAFGISGAVFQSLARNPLASPDIIGVNAGAGAAAVLVIVALGGSTVAVSLAALAGALGSALAVYLLAYRRGVTGYRLVLVGIGVTAVLTSVTSFLLTRAEIVDAQRATVWLTGSLNGRGWEHVRPVGLALVVLAPLALALGRQLRVLQMGDDAARGLGVRVEAGRLGLILTGVGLAAVATASAGPVAFVALVSPQIARRLAAGPGPALGAAALVGVCVMLAADLTGRLLFAPTELPVGVVTAVVGAPYLLWLLARANRVGSGG
jgi:iron complex transport system permease protein